MAVDVQQPKQIAIAANRISGDVDRGVVPVGEERFEDNFVHFCQVIVAEVDYSVTEITVKSTRFNHSNFIKRQIDGSKIIGREIKGPSRKDLQVFVVPQTKKLQIFKFLDC